MAKTDLHPHKASLVEHDSALYLLDRPPRFAFATVSGDFQRRAHVCTNDCVIHRAEALSSGACVYRGGRDHIIPA